MNDAFDPLPEGTPRHQLLVPAARQVWLRNQGRRQSYLYYAQLYGGSEMAGLGAMGVDPAAQIFQPATLPFNVIRSGVDTLVAKVAKNRPIPMYLPVGGDQRVHRRVKLLNRFVAGLFHQHRIHQRTPHMTRDAALYGTGSLYIHRVGDQPVVETVYPWEDYVDVVDARYGDPRCRYTIRYLDKDQLCAQYPDKCDEIRMGGAVDENFYYVSDMFSIATRVSVFEAWHLPSGPGANDGRHSVCLTNSDLLDEPYTRDEFPFVDFYKNMPLAGYWGTGLADEMSGFQTEINVIADRVQTAHHMAGSGVWMVPQGSGLFTTDFTNDIGVILEHAPGMAPEHIQPEPVHEQTYQYLQDLTRFAYAFSGISQMSVQSQKPPGVTAALALQTLDDIETERFSLFERQHEEAHVEIARHLLCQVREIADEYGDFAVFSANRTMADRLCWKADIDIAEDAYVVQAQPVSLLPKTPAAKLQRVVELSQANIFDRPQMLKLLNLPDTDAEEELLLSPRNVADEQIYAMLECEDPYSPEAFLSPEIVQDLAYSQQRAQMHYNRIKAASIARAGRVDVDTGARLTLLQRYIEMCQYLTMEANGTAEAQAALAPTASPATGQPAGQPPPQPGPQGSPPGALQ